ncbi:hypothetical protein MSG28_010809 [Choristoneura fumiferana]|uniref:Uncharacterized protein n=1 Tax=Choristoneura fumiferana TaxID=7141 RepID=A0ACC0KPG3_CHOFU|nr:hypothetical protein MSG28_010809 [Choristoneura fumiferana]
MPVPPTPPFRPFAPFPPFPPFGAGFGQFPNFPNFPQIPLPVVPTPDQIKNVNPGQGQVFHGVAVQSSSSMVQDKDGKWVRTGGTSVLTNDNGKVQEFKQGDAPPDLNVPIRAPTMPKMPEMKPFKFEPITFKPIVFEPIPPIDTEKLKTYQPKEGEQFFGSSVTSFSSSKTVNGKTVSEGGGSVIVNDNGKADEQHALRLGCRRAVTLAACKEISYNFPGRWPAMRPSFASTHDLRHRRQPAPPAPHSPRQQPHNKATIRD